MHQVACIYIVVPQQKWNNTYLETAWKLEEGNIANYYKQKIIQFIRRNQVYFSSSNVSTDTTVIVKDYMLSEKFTFCFKITIDGT